MGFKARARTGADGRQIAGTLDLSHLQPDCNHIAEMKSTARWDSVDAHKICLGMLKNTNSKSLGALVDYLINEVGVHPSKSCYVWSIHSASHRIEFIDWQGRKRVYEVNKKNQIYRIRDKKKK